MHPNCTCPAGCLPRMSSARAACRPTAPLAPAWRRCAGPWPSRPCRCSGGQAERGSQVHGCTLQTCRAGMPTLRTAAGLQRRNYRPHVVVKSLPAWHNGIVRRKARKLWRPIRVRSTCAAGRCAGTQRTRCVHRRCLSNPWTHAAAWHQSSGRLGVVQRADAHSLALFEGATHTPQLAAQTLQASLKGCHM